MAHEGGPLLVLAGPGTGKTTTIVESVVDRIERRGVDPERVLVLTFSRKAAEELRERITARMRRTTRSPLALTFHSYAYALLRREAVLAGTLPPRLLTGPEQLLEIRRLLHGELEDGAVHWPGDMHEALKTRGFAQELRDFLARAAERGLDGPELVELGRRHGRADWVAAGRFADRYHARFDLDLEPVLDYAELVRAAGALLADPEVRLRERSAYDAVFVDEYQDTDPAQEFLLQQLAGEGRDLVAVGDPDQSIYGFRGADVRGIMNFPDRFRDTDGDKAPVIALRVCRRSGAELLRATRRVTARLPAVPGGAAHRDLRPLPDTEPGEVRVLVADGATQEAALVADTLRRAHLLDGVPWSRMAVLVRSATRQVPLLRRALVTAGVPVRVGGAEVPLFQEPGVRPLVRLIQVALHPEILDEGLAEELLTGALGGTDMIGVRRLRRALRIAEHEALTHPDERDVTDRPADREAARPRSSGELLVAALKDARELVRVEPHVAAPAERLAGLISAATEAVRRGGSAEDVLWTVWQATGLAERWTQAGLAGGSRGSMADRDLDAVVALFDHAARFVDRLPHAGVDVFVEDLVAQEIPGDSLAARAPDGDTVKILTAHRSKGLEWDVVVVAGVQEGAWPDLRLRGSVLSTDDMVARAEGSEHENPAAVAAALSSQLLAEERRLFYVAATRARKRLVVTAVGGEDVEERPSRFLTELVPDSAGETGVDERSRWLSMPALVADLRSAVSDTTRPDALRRAAAGHLARLAAAGVPGAHPNEWYALTPISDDRPLSWPDGTVRVSPSAVESFSKCGLRWLLETSVGAGGTDAARGLGTVIHALAVLVASGMPTEETLGKRLDEIWHELDFGGVWYNRKQRRVAEEMISKFLRWHQDNPRELVGLEEAFTATVAEGVEIRGRVDRVERDGEGRAVIIDIKTGKNGPRDTDLDRHPQLGVYQLAALLGAFSRHGMTEPGGAALVQVGDAAGKKAAKEQAQRPLSEDSDPGWARDMVDTVAAGMSGPFFQAKVNDGCRTCAVRSSCPVSKNGDQVC
ncbi:superfamily I DNA/RNA helicase/RecB family exonuclease [Streptosporangium becharense]|uniref:DNA 3'-5' helicase n=1 Tax=Streptosporangium becharense TaxID=1816182 RepID=A0A7W9II77_9ACTN|nr:superfamily I DNA/RNA helicase/RecB family exonuclease [Streptosporangium becharense]MBB5821237.1 superfamily I DNA/RNA helicase/RecB family exonuclease [Streptosporangium becharense]